MENKTICSKCKGQCCKQMGCHFSPEDFKEISFEALKAEIDKGHISIDWWEGNPFEEINYSFIASIDEYDFGISEIDEDDEDTIERAYFLRAKNVGANIIDASWGGTCSLLTEKGCSLSYNDRPKGGRELIPVEGNKECITNYSKQDCAKEWHTYDDILTQLYDYYAEEI